MDIQLELDRSIGEGPPLPEPTSRVVAGRAALRRRRLASGAAVLTVAVVLGGTAYAVGSGDQPDGGRDANNFIATEPIEPAEPTEQPTVLPLGEEGCEAPCDQPEMWVTYDEDARLVRTVDDVTVTRLTHNPFPWPVEPTAAMVVERNGLRGYLWLAWTRDDGISTTTFEDPPSDLTFDRWLADMAENPTPFEFVDITRDGTLTAVPPYRLVDSRRDLDFPENFAPPGTPTWAAEVTYDGQTWFVLARWFDGDPMADVIPWQAEGDRDTLEEFLPWARERYVDEVGLR